MSLSGSASVAILGGGVAGLTAAQELAERGFSVSVYEALTTFGGKARSFPLPGSGTEGRRDLPGEHGFRFFPGFYQHLPDTMRRIPFAGNADGVFGNLVSVRQLQVARVDQSELHFNVHLPRHKHDWAALIQSIVDATDLGISPGEAAFFASRIWVLLTTCEQRRLEEYEYIPWWDFIDADNRSENYRKYLAGGLTRSLVAMRAEEASTRTVGYVLVALMFDMLRSGATADRVLVGPTNDVWIDPWTAHLQKLGVALHTAAAVKAFRLEGRRVRSVDVEIEGRTRSITADHYVVALPHQVLAKVLDDELRAAAPSLSNLHRLKAEWMNGILYYLDRDVSVVQGHSLFVDSPWALTSISQRQFWTGVDFSKLGNGRVKGILSVDISDWDTPGIVYNKPARQCSAQEIRDEVWAQIKAHLHDHEVDILDDAAIVDWFLDPTIEFRGPCQPHNPDPLLVNVAGSWQHRPEAATEIENLTVAGDFVRTHTDLATMEAANEAARRAVNAILDRCGSRAKRCEVLAREEPAALAPFRALDELRYRLGLSHLLFDSRKLVPHEARVDRLQERLVSQVRRAAQLALGAERRRSS